MIGSCPKRHNSLVLGHCRKRGVWPGGVGEHDRHSRNLIFPDFQLLDAAGPISAFEIAGRLSGRRTHIKVLAPTGGAGCAVPPAWRWWRAASRGAGPLDTLDRPRAARKRAGRGCRSRSSPLLKSAVRRTRRIARVVAGAYIPGAGRAAGRPPLPPPIGDAPAISSRPIPRCGSRPDRIFVKDDNVWTSAGISAGIDMALAIIAEDFGEDIARETRAPARGLSPPLQRPVAVLSALLELKEPTRRFKPAAGLGARTSRRDADGRADGGAGAHEFGGTSPARSSPRPA